VVESYLYAMQAVQTSNPAQNFFTTPDGEVLAYSSSSGMFVPLTDVLGSTIALTDSGKLYTQYKYEPFGVPTTSGQSSNYPYLFAGMEYDPTGLYHTYARYYSPRLQRFISEDPLQYGGGDINLFRYAADDPVNAADPLGLQVEVPSIPDVGGVALARVLLLLRAAQRRAGRTLRGYLGNWFHHCRSG
jgi:RHS repeat-associated protein